jgi:hypothetical protein
MSRPAAGCKGHLHSFTTTTIPAFGWLHPARQMTGFDFWLQASQLTMVPMVPVAAGSRLIAPGRLFARLPQNLAPFAYEVALPPSQT